MFLPATTGTAVTVILITFKFIVSGIVLLISPSQMVKKFECLNQP
jgi:hypothetical protein